MNLLKEIYTANQLSYIENEDDLVRSMTVYNNKIYADRQAEEKPATVVYINHEMMNYMFEDGLSPAAIRIFVY